MPQWNPEQEAEFQELCRRAAEQSRELAGRVPQPPPDEAVGGQSGGAAAEQSSAPRAGGAGTRASPACGSAAATPAVPFRQGQGCPTVDRETLLILLVLAFLIRQKADRELVWAMLYVLMF